jgi:hypothetical protein
VGRLGVSNRPAPFAHLYALFALQAGEQAVGVKEMIYGLPFLAAVWSSRF